MKVAVISGPGSQCGKSTFCLMLGMLFARTQQRTSVLLATDKMEDLLDSIKVNRDKSLLTSVAMIESILLTSNMASTGSHDHGIHIGQDSCFAYDLYDSTYDREHLNETLLLAMKKIKSDLTLIEVNGVYDGAFERRLLKEVDAILYLFTTSLRSMKELVQYRESMPEDITRKTGYICSMYNSDVVSEKAIAKQIASSVKNVMLFPYNANLAKEALAGKLDTIPAYIASGKNEVINLRGKLLEVMQYLFDTPKVKYIRDMTKWGVQVSSV